MAGDCPTDCSICPWAITALCNGPTNGDLTTLKVFSSLNKSIILGFYSILFHEQISQGPLMTHFQEDKTYRYPASRFPEVLGNPAAARVLLNGHLATGSCDSAHPSRPSSATLRGVESPVPHVPCALNTRTDASSGTRGAGTGGTAGTAQPTPARATGWLCGCQLPLFFLFKASSNGSFKE